MRWRWPPENSCGKRLSVFGSRPTSTSVRRTRSSRWRRAAADAVDDQAFLDDLLHRQARVERRERVLEDHLHLRPERPHLGLRLRVEAVALPVDRAAVIVQQLQDGLAERRLAGAGLADDAERLAAPQLQADVVDGDQQARLAAEHACPSRSWYSTRSLSVSSTISLFGATGFGRPDGCDGQQLLRIGVLRRGEERAGRVRLQHAAEPHDRHRCR